MKRRKLGWTTYLGALYMASEICGDTQGECPNVAAKFSLCRTGRRPSTHGRQRLLPKLWDSL